MQASMNALLRNYKFTPHYDMIRSQYNNYRVTFDIFKKSDGTVDMEFAFQDHHTHMGRTFDLTKHNIPFAEFEKMMHRKDALAKTIIQEMKKGKIQSVKMNFTLSISWSKHVGSITAMQMKSDQIVQEVLTMNPNGPHASLFLTGIKICGPIDALTHPSFPTEISLHGSSSGGWWARKFPLLGGRPPKDRWSAFHIRVDYWSSDVTGPDERYLFNGKTGAPSTCTFDYYGKSIDDVAALLYTYNSNKIQDFFQGLSKATTIQKSEYYYDGKLIPTELLLGCSFPLDEAQEFDLMMRL